MAPIEFQIGDCGIAGLEIVAHLPGGLDWNDEILAAVGHQHLGPLFEGADLRQGVKIAAEGSNAG